MSFLCRWITASPLLARRRTTPTLSFYQKAVAATQSPGSSSPPQRLSLGNSFLLNLLRPLLLQQQQHQNYFCWTTVRCKHTLKTNKAVAKRFRVRGDGSLKRTKSGAQHNTGYRSRGSINKLGQSAPIKNKKMERKMKICMGVK